MKKTYTKPSMEKIGSFESVTKATGSTTKFDAALPAGATLADATFS